MRDANPSPPQKTDGGNSSDLHTKSKRFGRFAPRIFFACFPVFRRTRTMTHAQISPTGRRPDFAASYFARAQSHAPLFTVTNKDLLKAAADAAKALALNPKERQVLTELALCFGGQQLDAGLLCWPSNAHLSDRTNIPERTLSRVLSTLCRQGLIVARDSANGKRFPIKIAKARLSTPAASTSLRFIPAPRTLPRDAKRSKLRPNFVASCAAT